MGDQIEIIPNEPAKFYINFACNGIEYSYNGKDKDKLKEVFLKDYETYNLCKSEGWTNFQNNKDYERFYKKLVVQTAKSQNKQVKFDFVIKYSTENQGIKIFNIPCIVEYRTDSRQVKLIIDESYYNTNQTQSGRKQISPDLKFIIKFSNELQGLTFDVAETNHPEYYITIANIKLSMSKSLEKINGLDYTELKSVEYVTIHNQDVHITGKVYKKEFTNSIIFSNYANESDEYIKKNNLEGTNKVESVNKENGFKKFYENVEKEFVKKENFNKLLQENEIIKKIEKINFEEYIKLSEVQSEIEKVINKKKIESVLFGKNTNLIDYLNENYKNEIEELINSKMNEKKYDYSISELKNNLKEINEFNKTVSEKEKSIEEEKNNLLAKQEELQNILDGLSEKIKKWENELKPINAEIEDKVKQIDSLQTRIYNVSEQARKEKLDIDNNLNEINEKLEEIKIQKEKLNAEFETLKKTFDEHKDKLNENINKEKELNNEIKLYKDILLRNLDLIEKIEINENEIIKEILKVFLFNYEEEYFKKYVVYNTENYNEEIFIKLINKFAENKDYEIEQKEKNEFVKQTTILYNTTIDLIKGIKKIQIDDEEKDKVSKYIRTLSADIYSLLTKIK